MIYFPRTTTTKNKSHFEEVTSLELRECAFAVSKRWTEVEDDRVTKTNCVLGLCIEASAQPSVSNLGSWTMLRRRCFLLTLEILESCACSNRTFIIDMDVIIMTKLVYFRNFILKGIISPWKMLVLKFKMQRF